MLEDLLLSLGRAETIESALRAELERLQREGYLDEVPEGVWDELRGRLEGRAERARQRVKPLVEALGASLRAALDLPSRSDIVALTEALERAEATRAAAGAGERAPATADPEA
ncbi:MAG: hypothetical protein D6731_20270 [Planctomycetota bacterium]|nr:MAG: hypothetical protein D6731_20270 [Planctomycetota bacterium]